MSDENKIVSVIGSIYTHFVYRDATYVAGGLLVLAIPLYSNGITALVTTWPWWAFVPVVIASYVVGLFAMEAATAVRVIRMFSTSGSRVDQEIAYLTDMRNIGACGVEASLLRLERVIALKTIAGVTGSCGILAFAVLQVYYWTDLLRAGVVPYLMLTAALAALSVVMVVCNRTKAKVQDEFIRTLKDANARNIAQQGGAPNGGPATPQDNSGVTEGPPSVS